MVRGVTCELETDYYSARRVRIQQRTPSSRSAATKRTHHHFIVKIMRFWKGKRNFPHRRLCRTFSPPPRKPSKDMSIKFLRKFSCLHLCNLLPLIIFRRSKKGEASVVAPSLFDSNYSKLLLIRQGFVEVNWIFDVSIALWRNLHKEALKGGDVDDNKWFCHSCPRLLQQTWYFKDQSSNIE